MLLEEHVASVRAVRILVQSVQEVSDLTSCLRASRRLERNHGLYSEAPLGER